MRIISGKFKGKKLHSPSGTKHLRPTSDRVREAVFNIIGQDLAGCTILDLFAGTGAFGIEALSRKAEFVHFVEINNQNAGIIKKNLETCGCVEQSNIIISNTINYLNNPSNPSNLINCKFDIIFADPPYEYDDLTKFINHDNICRILKDDGLFVLETAATINQIASLKDLKIKNLGLYKTKTYGKTRISIFEHL